MTGPPGRLFQAAPPDKRAKPDGIPVRLHDGTLVAHANQGLEDKLLTAGVAESFRRGPRRYLRLRQGISVPRTPKGWDLIRILRTWDQPRSIHKEVRLECYASENLNGTADH
jgi:hypothetical protein